jgi:hypothetical protein
MFFSFMKGSNHSYKLRYNGYNELICRCLLNNKYTKLAHMRIIYGEITHIHGKTHMANIEAILKLDITKLSNIENIMFWSWLYVALIKSIKWANIGYNINYIKIFK